MTDSQNFWVGIDNHFCSIRWCCVVPPAKDKDIVLLRIRSFFRRLYLHCPSAGADFLKPDVVRRCIGELFVMQNQCDSSLLNERTKGVPPEFLSMKTVLRGNPTMPPNGSLDFRFRGVVVLRYISNRFARSEPDRNNIRADTSPIDAKSPKVF
jgi:hypothetical protein